MTIAGGLFLAAGAVVTARALAGRATVADFGVAATAAGTRTLTRTLRRRRSLDRLSKTDREQTGEYQQCLVHSKTPPQTKWLKNGNSTEFVQRKTRPRGGSGSFDPGAIQDAEGGMRGGRKVVGAQGRFGGAKFRGQVSRGRGPDRTRF